MQNQTPEPHDDHRYGWVMLYTETVRFLVSALNFYQNHLASEAERVNSDPHLRSFISEETRREFRIGRDLDYARRITSWLSDKLEAADNDYDINISLDHGTARFLKSVGLLYLGLIKNKRNALARDQNISHNTIRALDREIVSKEEFLTKAGIFASATVLPLLAVQQVPEDLVDLTLPSQEESISRPSKPAVVVVDSIEIMDEELRRRCLDLFRQFHESGQSERHDTVVAEATRILEHRMRSLTNADTGLTGTELANKVFSGDSPLLRVSDIVSEQKAVHLLFLGTFGFIRNPVHHKLLSDLAANRVVQILGLVDYLISVLNSANKPTESAN